MIDEQLKMLKNFTLLLVEDDGQMLGDMERVFAIFFDKILCARDGAVALELYGRHAVDIVISDYVLPIMNGAELCQLLRKENPHIPLIIITSQSDEEKLLSLITLNLTEYVIKPISYEKITAMLQAVAKRIQKDGLFTIALGEGPSGEALSYDKASKSILSPMETTRLTKSEAIMLELLIQHKSALVSQEMIFERFWEQESFSEQSIKNIIFRLRGKIGKERIINIKLYGYMLRA